MTHPNPPWMRGDLPVEYACLTILHYPDTGEAAAIVSHVFEDGGDPDMRIYQALPLGPFYWRLPMADAIDLLVDTAAEMLGWDAAS